MINPPPLDASQYNLDEDEVALFKLLTGIEKEEELKQYVLDIQHEAYKVSNPLWAGLEWCRKPFSSVCRALFVDMPLPVHTPLRVCKVCVITTQKENMRREGCLAYI